MKTLKCLLLLTALSAAALLTGGCASVPDYAGELVYYDAGCMWRWQEGGLGWRYLGFHGHGAVPPEGHRPPPPGSLPVHEPGQVPPCYFFLGKNGSVLASLDGKSFRDVGSLTEISPLSVYSILYSSRLAWYEGGFGGGGKAAAGANSFHLASRPVSGVRQFLSSATAFGSGSPTVRGGADFRSAGYSRSSNASGWSGGGSRGGGWSGGGGGGFSHSSSGGGGGGGGSRGGGNDGRH